MHEGNWPRRSAGQVRHASPSKILCQAPDYQRLFPTGGAPAVPAGHRAKRGAASGQKSVEVTLRDFFVALRVLRGFRALS